MQKGFLPHVGLHRRAGMLRHESSYSHIVFFAVMLIVALTAHLMLKDWHDPTMLGPEARYIVIGSILWGGLCGFVPYFIRNKYGQTLSFDPYHQRLSIRWRQWSRHPQHPLRFLASPMELNIPWQQIVGLQICATENSHQLNLVWRDADNAVVRRCLLNHANPSMVRRLARQYERALPFPIMDHSGRD